MAKHNINHSKTQRLLAQVKHRSPFNHAPIVIPRDKLEIAHLKVKKAQAKNKYLIAIIITLVGALIWTIAK